MAYRDRARLNIALRYTQIALSTSIGKARGAGRLEDLDYSGSGGTSAYPLGGTAANRFRSALSEDRTCRHTHMPRNQTARQDSSQRHHGFRTGNEQCPVCRSLDIGFHSHTFPVRSRDRVHCATVGDRQPDIQALEHAHFMNENYDEAIRWTDQGLKIAPTSSLRAQYLFYRAWYLVWLGRLREAEAALVKSERMASPSYDQELVRQISWLRGWCAYERGDSKEARLHLSGFAKRSSLSWYS
jgi:tetratricopeptide (TPR) repeat protein